MKRISGAHISKKPETIDEYLAQVSDDKRAALETLRKTIGAVAPQAEECISYGIPGFRLNGYLVGFAAGKNRCAFYPGTVLRDFAEELEDYETSKGTIRFQPKEPLPASLVRRIVKIRIEQNASRKAKNNPQNHTKRHEKKV